MKNNQDYVDYFMMLLENNIRWNESKTLDEMKKIANENNLDINIWRKSKEPPKLKEYPIKPKKRKIKK